MRDRAFLCNSILFPYGFAILCTLIATWARYSLTPWLGDRVPFGCFFVSVLISAGIGGTGPAIVSLVLGLLLAARFIIPPDRSLWITQPSDLFSMIVYFIVGAASIGLFFLLDRRTRDAERQAAENGRLSTELRLRDRRKDEFLAVLAHELRNPLAPIRTGVSLICRRCEHDPSTDELVRMLNRQVDQLSSIVDDLMDVSLYIRDQISLEFEVVNVAEIAESVREAVAAEMLAKQHRFTFSISRERLFVNGDRVRLIQIVTNVLQNAVRYTPAGGRIQLFVSGTDNDVVFEIRDNGIGIDEECQNHIFEMFSQVESVRTREQGGLGLGLSIVRSLTEKHGGSVSVHSEGRGRGSRFLVTLPRLHHTETGTRERLPRLSHSHGTAPVGVQTAQGSTALVYIVDDNLDAAATLAALLNLDDFQTRCFDDGPSLLDAIVAVRPNAVILDIGLPGMDGYEIARRIRSMPGGTDVRLLACTGWGSEADFHDSREAGIDRHLVKPVNPSEVVDFLRDAAELSVT